MFEKIKTLLKHSFTYGLGSVARQIISFFLIPLFTRYLTPSDYGILAMTGILSMFLVAFNNLGVGSAVFRYFNEYEDSQSKRKLLSTAFIVLILSAGFSSFIFFVFSKSVSLVLFGSQNYYYYCQIIAITSFCAAVINLPLIVLRCENKSATFVKYSLVQFTTNILLTILLVVVFKKGVLGVLYSDLIASFFVLILFIPFILKRSGIIFSAVSLRELLSFGLPMIPHKIMGQFLFMTDRYFLNRFTNLSEVGLYSIATKFAGILGLVIGTFQTAWLPYKFSLLKKDSNPPKTIARITSYYLLGTVFSWTALSVFSKELIYLMTTPSFYRAFVVVPLAAGLYLFQGMYFMFVTLDIAKKTKFMPIITGSCLVINIILNITLVPRYGMMGSALAVSVTWFSMFLLASWFTKKFYPVPFESYRIEKIFLAGLMIYGLSSLVNFDSLVFDFILKIILLGIYPLILFVFGFFTSSELQKVKGFYSKLFKKSQY